MSAICGTIMHHKRITVQNLESENVFRVLQKNSQWYLWLVAILMKIVCGFSKWETDLMNVWRLLRLWFREWRVTFEQLWKTNKIMQNCAVCVWLWLIGIISETAELICLHEWESRERGCDIIFAIIALMRHHNDHYVFTATSNFNRSPKYIECGAGVVLAAVHLLLIYIKPT